MSTTPEKNLSNSENSSPVHSSVTSTPSTSGFKRLGDLIATSPAPKIPRTSLEDTINSLTSFSESQDIQMKAVMFSVIKGNSTEAEEDLAKLRTTGRSFLMNTVSSLKCLQLSHNALQQKMDFTQKYNLHLHRENNELRKKVEGLTRQLAVKDLNLEDSLFEEDMDASMDKGPDNKHNNQGDRNVEAPTTESANKDPDEKDNTIQEGNIEDKEH